jgi:teichuronic acid biosynthesis glycosyltransferase TuaH
VKKKIIYLSHVNWRWIKQRPQFLFEELGESYECIYVTGRNYKKRDLTESNDSFSKLFIRQFYRIPKRIKAFSRLIILIDIFICRIQILKIFRQFPPDILWVTSPEVSQYVPKKYLTNTVFDFMDDYPEIVHQRLLKNNLEKELKVLLKTCPLIFASSSVLLNKAMFFSSGKVVQVNNAISLDFLKSVISLEKKANSIASDMLKLVYIGAISKWFDSDLIKQISYEFSKKIEIDLFGPLEIELPSCQNVHYRGVVSHEHLPRILSEYDVFIMPFVINPLILAVDPVKIYEYIAFNKFIIAPYYSELDKFNEFVFTYNSKEEFSKIINDILSKKLCPPDAEKALVFLNNNSWSFRARLVLKELGSFKSGFA